MEELEDKLSGLSDVERSIVCADDEFIIDSSGKLTTRSTHAMGYLALYTTIFTGVGTYLILN